MPTFTSPPRPERSKALPIAGLLLLVAVAGFAVGEWAQGGPAAHPPASAAQRAATEPAPADAAPGPAPWATSAPGAPAASRLAASAVSAPAPRASTLELVTRASEQTKAKIEALRSYIDASCWPGPGAAKVKVTFNVTFDAAGREIARGISEDRRAPAREFGRCLRKLQGTGLAISPPGANVAVAVPVSFP